MAACPVPTGCTYVTCTSSVDSVCLSCPVGSTPDPFNGGCMGEEYSRNLEKTMQYSFLYFLLPLLLTHFYCIPRQTHCVLMFVDESTRACITTLCLCTGTRTRTRTRWLCVMFHVSLVQSALPLRIARSLRAVVGSSRSGGIMITARGAPNAPTARTATDTVSASVRTEQCSCRSVAMA